MTVGLTGNFLTNARGFRFTDTASVTWAFNTQTNSLTATSSGGGGGSSANPSATIGLTAVNGSAGTFMTSDSAPPLSQGIVPTWTGAHTFNSTVTIGGSGNDSGIIFTGSSGYINASGATGLTIAATHAFTVSAANYTFEIGGSSIWTMDASGSVTQQAATGETSLVVYGAANHYVQQLVGSSTNNESFGLLLQAGTSSSDYNVRFESYATGVLATLYGDGGLAVGAAPTGASTGIGTINVAGGYYINGTALSFTSLSPLTTEGDLIYENATPAPARLAIGGTGTFLTVAAGIPAWSTATIPGTATKGDLWYASAANVISALAVGTTGQLLTVAGGVPAWEAIPTWNQNTTGNAASATVATNLGGAPVGGSFKVGGSSWLRTIIHRGRHTVDLARQPATTLAAKAIWASYFFPAQAGSIPFQTAANTTELLPYSQPGLYLTSNASGAPQWTLPSANPSGLVGLTAIVGSAVTFLRSDAAPALNVTISPTWTGTHTFAPTSGVAAIFTGAANVSAITGSAADSNYVANFTGSTTSGKSFGFRVNAGTTSADQCVEFNNQGASVTFLFIKGDGSGNLGGSAGSAITWTTGSVVTIGTGLTATTAVTLGAGASNTVGFYGTSPVGQTASNSSMVTSNVSSLLSTVATASSTALTTAVNATINAHGSAIIQNGKMLQQVINVLQAIGIYATH